MCSHYRSAHKKGGREREPFGYDEVVDLPRDIYPDRSAPILRWDGDAGYRWQPMRWGFPPPGAGGKPVVNVRNLASPYWRPWLVPRYRCLVPFEAFSEFSGSGKGEAWFGLASGEPAAFAGIWCPWTGMRGPRSRPVDGEHRLFAFLTCQPNSVVSPFNAHAMPVILATPEKRKAWLAAPLSDVSAFACPIADSLLAKIGQTP